MGGGPWNDLQCEEISSLLSGQTVYVPGFSVPGFKGLVDRKIGLKFVATLSTEFDERFTTSFLQIFNTWSQAGF
jgi:hypothetical protein